MTGSLTFLDMAQMTHLADAPAVRRGLRRAPISHAMCQSGRAMRQVGRATRRAMCQAPHQVMPRVGDGLTQRRVVDLGRTGSSVCRSH